MDLKQLRILEDYFLARYPQGFDSPEMAEIAKKHKVPQTKAFVEEAFAEENFFSTPAIIENFTKLITKSSLVSVFEKVKFKDVVKMLSESEKEALAKGIYESLYGSKEAGMGLMIAILAPYKMAKWPILTVLGAYHNAYEEVFIKPTTAKMVLNYFGVTEFKYSPKASYDFYRQYKAFINDLKAQSDPRLHLDNPAYSGFLMITIGRD